MKTDTPTSILVLSRHYAPEPTGSAPVIQEVAEWLAAEGHSVRVVSVRPNYPGTAIFDGYRHGERDRALENGVVVRRLSTSPLRGAGLMARLGPEARFFVDLVVGAATGTIAPAHRVISLCPSILTTLGASFLLSRGGRHLVIVHDIQSGLGSALGSGPLKLILPILRLLEAFALNRADQVVVLSEAMRTALSELGVRRPIAVLPPSIDTRRIAPLARPEGTAPTLLYSGNLGRKQGLEQLIDLADLLSRRAPQVRVVIRGDGAMRMPLTEEAERRKLHNLRFAPLVGKEALSSALAEGDLHLVPQVASGGDFAVPSKAFAIMAAGRTFIATATAESALGRLASASGAFVCVPPGDTIAFADMALSLLEDAPRRKAMGERGRSYVEREVDTDVVMRLLLPLLVGGG